LPENQETLALMTLLLKAISEGHYEECQPLLDEINLMEVQSEAEAELVVSTLSVVDQIIRSTAFLKSISEGKVDSQPPKNIPMLAHLKQIHANQRSLLWSMKRVAEGDYTHPNPFMGDFTDVYEKLVCALRTKSDVEARLEVSEQMYRMIVNLSPDFVFLLDVDGTIEFISPAGKRIFGNQDDAYYLNRNIIDFLEQEDRQVAFQCLTEVLAGEELRVRKYHAKNTYGVIMTLLADVDCIKDKDGEIEKFFMVARDITDQEGLLLKANQTAESNQMLVESMASPVCISALGGGNIFYVNAAARQMLKIKEGDPPRPLSYYVDERYHDVLDGEAHSKPIEVKLKDSEGGDVWVQARAVRITYEGRDASLISCVDITAQRATEESLAIARRKIDLFTSLMRHDIVNLVNAVHGNVELARYKAGPEAGKYLDKADQAINEIGRQMEISHRYQYIGGVGPEWIDSGMLERELQMIDMEEVNLDVDLPPMEILADSQFISCMRNIVDNSFKHGIGLHEVRVYCEENGNTLKLIIEDDGRGIPLTDKERIFDWNYKGRSGHALHFIREVLATTGMSVHETGQPGNGARFEILVPFGAFKMLPKKQKVELEDKADYLSDFVQ